MSYIIVKKRVLSNSMEIMFKSDKLHLIEAQYLAYRDACLDTNFEFLVLKDLKVVRKTEVVKTHRMVISQ